MCCGACIHNLVSITWSLWLGTALSDPFVQCGAGALDLSPSCPYLILSNFFLTLWLLLRF
jgi:hypothetical protein